MPEKYRENIICRFEDQGLAEDTASEETLSCGKRIDKED